MKIQARDAYVPRELSYGENRWCLPLGDRRRTEPLCQRNAPHPSLRPPDSLSQLTIKKKILSPFSHFTKIRMQHLNYFNQAASMRLCLFAIIRGVGSRPARAYSSKWGVGLIGAGSQRAVEVPPCPRRDVGYSPRWWKLAASRARVVGCRSRGLGLHLPTLPC